MSLQFSCELINGNFMKARIVYETGHSDKKLYVDPYPEASIDQQLDSLICRAASMLTIEMYKWLIDTLDTIEIVNTETNQEHFEFGFDYIRYFKAAIEAGNTKVAEEIFEIDFNNIRRQSDNIMIEYLKCGRLMAFKVALYVFGHGIDSAELIKHDISRDVLDWYVNIMDIFNKAVPGNRDYLLF